LNVPCCSFKIWLVTCDLQVTTYLIVSPTVFRHNGQTVSDPNADDNLKTQSTGSPSRGASEFDQQTGLSKLAEPIFEPAESDALDEALARVGDRWTLLIVRRLLIGPGRFNELMDQVNGIAPNILTKRLRQLETDGLLVASPYSQRPLRLRYTLTQPGQELASALEQLRSWGAAQVGAPLPRHDSCGTALQWRPWCPTCNRPVEITHAHAPGSPAAKAASTVPNRVDDGVDWV
jgi:DNA-binding HxlR family transcriptional regulator